jgi:hypothetical protein
MAKPSLSVPKNPTRMRGCLGVLLGAMNRMRYSPNSSKRMLPPPALAGALDPGRTHGRPHPPSSPDLLAVPRRRAGRLEFALPLSRDSKHAAPEFGLRLGSAPCDAGVSQAEPRCAPRHPQAWFVDEAARVLQVLRDLLLPGGPG